MEGLRTGPKDLEKEEGNTREKEQSENKEIKRNRAECERGERGTGPCG